MRRFVLLASLLCSQALLTGCFTGGNLMIMSSLDRDRIEEVETPIAQTSALRVSEDRIEVQVRYADGARRAVRLELSSGTFCESTPLVSAEGELPIADRIEVEGLSLVGGVLRWRREPGASPASFDLRRRVSQTAQPTVGDRVGDGFKRAACLLALPLTLGLDAGTFPLQALGLWIYKKAGGSFLSFG